VSAAALWYKAQHYIGAERLAHHWLSTQHLPPFAVEQLQILLQAIWGEQVRQRAGIRFSRGEVMVAVKGGEILTGGAPLDLIVSKVEAVQALFYRTTEFLRGLPHRKRGPASTEIQQACRPWLFQTAPGSYQFAVAIEEPAQGHLFAPPTPSSQNIAHTFLRVLRASADDPDKALVKIVQDADYRATFLKLTRNLAPTGKSFSHLEIRSPEELKPITLLPSARQSISEAIRRQFPRLTSPGEVEITLRGILRALHLDQDWLEITMDQQHVKVFGVGEAVDDVVGPMVNKPVLVEVLKQPSGKYTFRDIQLAE
jgi:hypothetical protein